MIKHFTVGSALAALMAMPAFAGGYVAPIIETAPQIQVVPAVVPAWTGGYVGANLNYGKAKVKLTDDGESLGDVKPDGANGAIRGGYDWQMGQGLFGLGAEYNLGKYKDDFDGDSYELKNVATVFARAGYAFNENLLGYGLLGYTRGKLEAPGLSETVDGWTVGLGTEYRFNQNWSGYAEYAYSDLGDEKSVGIDEVTLNQVKLGVNFRF